MKLWRTTAALALAICEPVSAADFDGSKSLICAPVEAMDCMAGEPCSRGVPESVGAPAFLRVDMAKKVIIGPKQTTPILFMDKTADRVLLQGTEFGYGWMIALDQESGKISATLIDETGVFVLFGSCTPL